MNNTTPTRKQYLQNLASEYDIPEHVVFTLADMLGPSEDHDGLISELEDLSLFGDFEAWD